MSYSSSRQGASRSPCPHPAMDVGVAMSWNHRHLRSMRIEMARFFRHGFTLSMCSIYPGYRPTSDNFTCDTLFLDTKGECIVAMIEDQVEHLYHQSISDLQDDAFIICCGVTRTSQPPILLLSQSLDPNLSLCFCYAIVVLCHRFIH